MAGSRRFGRADIVERNSRKDAVFIIDNVVYDVTSFLDDHPGGHEVLVKAAGKDASDDFRDIGHSLDAKEMMKKYAIGELVDEDKKVPENRNVVWLDSASEDSDGGFLGSWKLPVLLGVLATALYTYLFS